MGDSITSPRTVRTRLVSDVVRAAPSIESSSAIVLITSGFSICVTQNQRETRIYVSTATRSVLVFAMPHKQMRPEMKASWLCGRDAHLRTASLSKLDVAEMKNRSEAAHHVLLLIRREPHRSIPIIQPIQKECSIAREGGVCIHDSCHTLVLFRSRHSTTMHTLSSTHEHANSIISTRPLSFTTLLHACQHGIARWGRE